jgi:DNA-binding CsgD family transcriptional regulator
MRSLLGELGEIVGAESMAILAHRPSVPGGDFGPPTPHVLAYANDRVRRRRAKITADFLAKGPVVETDRPTREIVSGWGTRRVRIRSRLAREVVAGSPSEELMDALSIRDRMIAVHPVDANREVYLVFDRAEGTFDDRDLLLGKAAVSALGPLGRSWSLGHLGPRRGLTPRERDVLRELLTGTSEKVGADRVGLTRATFHQHVVSIYRKLEVSSRAELMARFLGEPASPRRG